RIVTRDREGVSRLERELHRLAHPCTLLIAHAAPAPAPASASKPPASASKATAPATEASAAAPHAGIAAGRITARAVAALHHVARVVALSGAVGPTTGEIRSLGGRGHPGRAAEQQPAGDREQPRSVHWQPPHVRKVRARDNAEHPRNYVRTSCLAE